MHSSAPPLRGEPPVVLHPLWAPAHPRRADGVDVRVPVRRAHALHPAAAPRRGTRPGRRPRPVVPFDIPVEAFAVEVGGTAHPSVRRLGDRRLVYIEHRQAVRRVHRRRQLALAVGLSGAFVVVAATALAPGGHAVAVDAKAEPVVATRLLTPAARPHAAPAARPAEPPYLRARGVSAPSGPAAAPRPGPHAPEDRDERNVALPPWGRGPLSNDPFLRCTQGFESIHAGGYDAIGGGGQYMGAYQFDQVTWNGTARYLRRFNFVGVRPNEAPPAIQDLFAYTLYKWQGASHWNNRCAGLP